MTPTLNCRNSADVCRANGWRPGTVLEGDEGHGPTVIVVTAVGEQRLLARAVSHDGEPVDGSEMAWTLHCREWREVTP